VFQTSIKFKKSRGLEVFLGGMIGIVKITKGSYIGQMYNVEDKVAMQLGKG